MRTRFCTIAGLEGSCAHRSAGDGTSGGSNMPQLSQLPATGLLSSWCPAWAESPSDGTHPGNWTLLPGEAGYAYGPVNARLGSMLMATAADSPS
eukprot:m.34079 g.34079  ORF g.34079 m.34079 type:complete len:94 (-) comp14276_c0_seq6:252-533(-)